MSMTREEASVLLKMMFAFWANTHERTNVEMEMALNLAISALHPVSRGQIEQNKRRWEVQTSIFPYYYCSGCGESFEIHSYDKEKYRFCPYCMSPMTDEAVEMMLQRMETLNEDNGCS